MYNSEQLESNGYVQASIEDFKSGVGWFRKQLPNIGKQYMAFTSACFTAGTIPEPIKHLIALGLAMQIQDEYCIMYHADAALQTGATPDQLVETIAVCAAFGGGAALSQGATLIQEVLREHESRKIQ
ncbi:carboxymuconolactone decarboxylase family protein [Alicyclobacillus tolerans]|uniref:AhpD family alkylhydroperoxidase n=1 Tax=Alicyclobacillus tolerans TaxID=90970 RepID=A0ABT9LYA8_9BACL|nr:carboxymuconolactone decarboxylase family protein [Alicyclobacillus tengchongensis]MDP9729245.1 AhpD family alkylhydroperoxidase [Alicyclobacillus tengchongensis]